MSAEAWLRSYRAGSLEPRPKRAAVDERIDEVLRELASLKGVHDANRKRCQERDKQTRLAEERLHLNRQLKAELERERDAAYQRGVKDGRQFEVRATDEAARESCAIVTQLTHENAELARAAARWQEIAVRVQVPAVDVEVRRDRTEGALRKVVAGIEKPLLEAVELLEDIDRDRGGVK